MFGNNGRRLAAIQAAQIALAKQVSDLAVVVRRIDAETKSMAIDLTKITAADASIDAQTTAVLGLVQTMATEITTISGSSTDPATQASLDALADDLNTKAGAIAAAVTANTPAPANPPSPPAGS